MGSLLPGGLWSPGRPGRRVLLMRHHLLVDFYVGPAVLLLSRETVGVMAFIDESPERKMYTWCGFLDVGTYNVELRFRAIEDDRPMLALPGRDPSDIDVMFTNGQGIAFIGSGASPLEAPESF